MRTKLVLSTLATAALLLQVSAASAAVCGDAYYNHEIDWQGTSPLYFSVAGAPPNTCGHLYANRNNSGFVLNAANWICTDAFGNATKGPWSSNPDDETSYAYIDWGTCTSPVRKHIWDVGWPTLTLYAGAPNSFSGTATDEPWGAGFSASWSVCQVDYYNSTTQRWWSPSTGGYTSISPVYVGCSLNGMPAMSVTWSTSSAQRPDLSDHVSGNVYIWRAWVSDGGGVGISTHHFTY